MGSLLIPSEHLGLSVIFLTINFLLKKIPLIRAVGFDPLICDDVRVSMGEERG